MPKKDSVSALAALKEALTLCQDRNLHQITNSRVVRIQADGGGEFNNQKLKDLCFDKNIVSVFLSSTSTFIELHSRENGWHAEKHSPQNVEASPSRERMVVICVQVCRSHDARRPWQYPRRQLGIWKGHDKDQAKSLDDRGAVGYLLDIDIWQSGTTHAYAGQHSGEGLSTQTTRSLASTTPVLEPT